VLYPLSYGDGVRPGEIGGAEGDRTLDLRIANATLSQLSYRPTTRAAILAIAIRDVQWSFAARVSTRTIQLISRSTLARPNVGMLTTYSVSCSFSVTGPTSIPLSS
jgi:hypothetical protein